VFLLKSVLTENRWFLCDYACPHVFCSPRVFSKSLSTQETHVRLRWPIFGMDLSRCWSHSDRNWPRTGGFV